MNKEFIPYEEALALKELGFDESCMAIYYSKDKSFSWHHHKDHTNDEPILDSGEFNISAPLYQQAFRWFREKYNIHAEITWSPSYEYDPGEWYGVVLEITFVDGSYTKEWKAESPDMQRGEGKQLTYEEAELACLKKLIKIVKKDE
jgi:hypothetical protein